MKTKQNLIFNAVTAEADKISIVVDLNGIYGFFLQWQLAGSITGNMIVQASADGVNYYDVSSTAVTVGFVNLDAQYYQFAKVFFDRTTGTVTDLISAQMFCKGI